MKNIKIYIMIIMAAVLIALPTMAQTFGQQTPQNNVFQSTSTMQGSGSAYSNNPELNADGTASYSPAQAPGGRIGHIRKDGADPWGGQTMQDRETKEAGVPIGDAVLPLVLLACAYFIIRATRRRMVKE